MTVLNTIHRYLAEESVRFPLEPKLLVADTPTRARELLNAIARAGVGWVGWEATSLRLLSTRLARATLREGGLTLVDDIEQMRLLDRAVDRALPMLGDRRLERLMEGVRVRESIYSSVVQLRQAGADAHRLERAGGDVGRVVFLATVLRGFEQELKRAKLLDLAGLYRLLSTLIEEKAPLPSCGRLYLLSGRDSKGLEGRLRDALKRFGAQMVEDSELSHHRFPSDTRFGVEDGPGEDSATSSDLFTASTPTEELREVLRRILREGLAWDQVEIVATDPRLYGAALQDLSIRYEVPVTYAEGLPAGRARVGRWLETYLDWLTNDLDPKLLEEFIQSGAVAPLSGALKRDLIDTARRHPFRRGSRSFLRSTELLRAGPEIEGASSTSAEVLRNLLRQLLDPIRSPLQSGVRRASVAPASVAASLTAFIGCWPDGNQVENTLREWYLERLSRIQEVAKGRMAWNRAVESIRSLLASRIAPEREGEPLPWTSSPGHLHFAGLESGGLSGRERTFVVGLDADTLRADSSGPVLLSEEARRRSVPELPSAVERQRGLELRVADLLNRIRGRIVLSYSAMSRHDGNRLVPPASLLLDVLRSAEDDLSLSYRDLRERFGPVIGPSRDLSPILEPADGWLTVLDSGGVFREGTTAVHRHYLRLERGAFAGAARAQKAVSVYHGLLSQGYEFSGPTEISPTALEELGRCPRRYFYRQVLRLSPIEEGLDDPLRWLDAAHRGRLLHKVFELSLRTAREDGIPFASPEFAGLAESLLEESVRRARQVAPPPTDVAAHWEEQRLFQDVRSFIEMIRDVPPDWIELEYEFGGEGREVEMLTPSGDKIRLRGAMDRIDRLDDGRVRVVDYKTGRSAGYHPELPFDGGRRLQHFVYRIAAERLLDDTVEEVEYHFPTRAGRGGIVGYGRGKLAAGKAAIAALLEILGKGAFMATDDPEDCRYCPFGVVCRVRVDAYGKVSSPNAEWTRRVGMTFPEYEPLRTLRALDEQA